MATEVVIRRILVALDPASRQRALFEPAITLAGQLGAELQAMFVEDEVLLRVAELRTTREVLLSTAGERRTSAVEMARAMRVAAASLQLQIEALARQAGVVCRFETVRGRRNLGLARAGTGFDVIVAGSGGSGRVRMVRVLADTSAPGERALAVARTLVERYHARLDVLVPASLDAAARRALAREGADWLLTRDCEDAGCLDALAEHAAGAVLVLPADMAAIASPEALRAFLERVDATVVLVR